MKIVLNTFFVIAILATGSCSAMKIKKNMVKQNAPQKQSAVIKAPWYKSSLFKRDVAVMGTAVTLCAIVLHSHIYLAYKNFNALIKDEIDAVKAYHKELNTYKEKLADNNVIFEQKVARADF